MLEGDFEVAHFDAIRDSIARLGVADVRAFGLTWEDCEQILHSLSFTARVEIVAANMTKAALLFGSGISRDSGAWMVDEITSSIFEKTWRYHSRESFWSTPQSQIAANSYPEQGKAEAERAQEFLRIVRDYIDPHLRETENRFSHYEDLFSATQQAVWDATGEITNPLFGSVMSDLRAKTVHLYRNQHPHISGNPFASLASRASDLVQWAVYEGVGVTKPVKMDLISEVAKATDELDIFSLNHDTLIERQLDNAGVAFADGFGKARTSQFQWSWKAEGAPPVRLYKLHGSINWYRFRSQKGFDQYFKDLTGDPDHALDEDERPLSLLETIPAVLTGTTVKERTYGFGLTGEIFSEFRQRLAAHKVLISCGYGWLDKGINIRVIQWLHDSRDNRLVIMHGGTEEERNELRSRPVWFWRWDDLERAGKVRFLNKWLSECTVDDLKPYLSPKPPS